MTAPDDDERIPLLEKTKEKATADSPSSSSSSSFSSSLWSSTRALPCAGVLVVVMSLVAGVGWGHFQRGVGARGTLYALFDTEGLAMALKSLQCYVKMGEELGMEVAVGPYRSTHYEEGWIELDQMVKPGSGWRRMRETEKTNGEFRSSRCILGRNPGDRYVTFPGFTFGLPNGGEIKIDDNTMVTSYAEMIAKLRASGDGACVGSLVYVPECTSVDAQMDFQPSDTVAALMRSSKEEMFGAPDAPFAVVHYRRGDRCYDTAADNDDLRCRDVKEQPFLELCRRGEKSRGMGDGGEGNDAMPVYVATDDFTPRTQRELQRAGCYTISSIPGSDRWKSWEGAAFDQFLMSDATEFFSMGCSTMDTVASASRRLRKAKVGKWYVKSAGGFVDIPPTSTMVECLGAVAAAEAEAATAAEARAGAAADAGVGADAETA